MKSIIRCFALIAVVLSISLDAALGQSSRSGRSGRGRTRSEDRSASAEDSAQRNASTEGFLRRLDTNHNGMIDADEVPAGQKSLIEGIFRRVGIEPKYPIPLSRILEAMTGSASRGQSDSPNGAAAAPGLKPSSDGPKAGASAGGPAPSAVPGFGTPSGSGTKPGPASGSSAAAASPPSTSSNVPKPAGATTDPASKTPDPPTAPPRGSGRFRTPKERLPDGLPDWFRQKDVNGDGQVTMAEFTQEWTPEKVAEFERFDLNHDGIITAAECLKAEKRQNRTSK